MSNTEAGVAIGVLLIVYLVIIAVAFVIGIAAYVLQSLGMYAIAKRRNISNPVLAWIPVANMWLLGCIADHYDEAVKGVKKKTRVVLMVLFAAFLVTAVIYGVTMGIFTSVMVANNADSTAVIISAIAMLVGILLYLGVAVAMSVFQYIAYYKLLKSCRPDNAVLFIVLSIFLPTLPIFLFICRNDDKGMPVQETVVE